MDCDDDRKTVWCGNLSDKVTEELLYELFLQAGPVRRVKIPKDKDGKQFSYGFVTFKHAESVPYAISLIEGIQLCDRKLNLKPRLRQDHSAERGGAANQVVNNHLMARDFSPNSRRNNQNNYGYSDNYNGNGGNNRHHQMKHDRRGGGSYHNAGGRFDNSNNKPYSHHKNDRNRRNRH